MTPALIAVDLGTSTIKGAVVEPETRRIRNIHRIPFPAAIPGLPPGFHEVSPGTILAEVRGLIRTLLEETPICQGIVMCGQMGGLILSNECGEPLSNYISWKDQRVTERHPSGHGSHFDVLVERLGQESYRSLGNEVRPGLPLSFLFWLAEERQPLPHGAVACSLGDFVAANLCRCPPCTHETSATGAWNLETRDWHWGAIDRLGLANRVKWPRLGSITEPVGYLDLVTEQIPWHIPTGDHQTALAGTCIGPSELSINISTGCQVSLLAPEFVPGNYQTRPYFDGTLLNTITHIPAGRALNTLVELLCELPARQEVCLSDPWNTINEAVAQVEGTDLCVDLSFFPSPVGQQGRIANIREGNLTVGSLFYAAYRNLAENCCGCALRLSPQRRWERVVFSGGLAERSEVLRRMILAKLSSPCRLSFDGEETLVGLLAQALVIGGSVPDVTSATAMLRARSDAVLSREAID